ncbi:MAG: ComEC/Rec2 family competence protein [Dialister sp.]|nr:ComEC/Rec2 family competence protein [Dialister sp.]
MIAVAMLMAAGILIFPHIVANSFYLYGALCVLFLLAAFLYSRGLIKTAVLLSACFVVICGITRAEIFENHWQAMSHHILGESGNYTVCVTERPLVQKDKGYARYLARLEEIRYKDGDRRPLSGSVYLYGDGETVYPTGSRLSVVGKITAPLIFDNLGKIHLAGRYRSMELIGRIYAEPGSITYEGRDFSSVVTKLSDYIHGRLRQLVMTYMDPVRASIVMTLLFGGNYQDISQHIMESFSVTGIIHILSVSGSHIALLFGFLCLLGKWFSLPRRITLILSVLLVLFYATLSGWVPPVVRASVMGVLSMGGLFLDRQRTSLNILGAAIFGMLLYDPMYIYDVSFQLSALASAGILIFYQPLSEWLAEHAPLPGFIREGTALCLAAQLLAIPVVLYDFHRLPLYSVFANLLVTPILEWVIIAGLFAALLSLMLLPLAGALLFLTDGMLFAALRINFFLSHLPYASIAVGGLGMIRSAAWYVLLFSVYGWHEISKRKGLLYSLVFLWVAMIGIVAGQIFYAPSLVVYVPQLGIARGAVLVSDAGGIVYYKNNGTLSMQSVREMESFVEYLGLSPLLFIHDREHASREIKALPDISAVSVVTSGGEGVRSWTAGDMRIITNGSSWGIENGKAVVYISGSRPYISEALSGKEILFIGGSQRFGSGVSDAVLNRLHPAAAAYAGGKTEASGEDMDRFHERDIDVYDVNREGLLVFAFTNRWDKESWSWLT